MASKAPFETRLERQRALVVHPYSVSSKETRSPSALLYEAVGLAEAIDLDVVQAVALPLRKHTPKTLIGGGQVADCQACVAEHSIDIVIMNTTLSPSQQRNLEKALGSKVIDRTALILEIFGDRARTAEGKLQVELAALTYQKSRLVRSWTHLERQRGGFGFMGGPGESQIETDRRLISDRILLIKRQLEKVVRTRELHRKTRRDTPMPVVALVGYTNAGKSTLFNKLTHAKVLAEDMLFATLDPTLRALPLPSGQKALLSDTVGFISNLPHELVAAFRATLEEVLEAHLLLHVRDIAHPDTAAQASDVYAVLQSLIGDRMPPLIEVWNKIDTLDAALIPSMAGIAHPVYLVSAHTGEGCDTLCTAIDNALKDSFYVARHYRIQTKDGRALAWLHAQGEVTAQRVAEDGQSIEIDALLRPEDASRFERDFLAKA